MKKATKLCQTANLLPQSTIPTYTQVPEIKVENVSSADSQPIRTIKKWRPREKKNRPRPSQREEYIVKENLKIYESAMRRITGST